MYTTDCNYFRITNYNTTQEGYYKWTGCTDIVSVSTINPLGTEYLCAKDLSVEGYSAPLDIVFVGLCPTATPTSSITPSVTPTVSITPTSITQTPTPTYSPTPSVTPSAVYERNLRTGGWYQNVCQSVNMIANPSNVRIFTIKPFDTLEVGDHVYGNKELTIAPIGANFTISDGAKFVQLSGTLIINVGVC
jgi:hypothetical protein